MLMHAMLMTLHPFSNNNNNNNNTRYASCKQPLVDVIEQECEIEIVKKLEIENGTEFTHEEFYNSLHPVAQVHSLKFSRPKGPGGRRPGGSRRPTRGSSGSAPK